MSFVNSIIPSCVNLLKSTVAFIFVFTNVNKYISGKVIFKSVYLTIFSFNLKMVSSPYIDSFINVYLIFSVLIFPNKVLSIIFISSGPKFCIVKPSIFICFPTKI